MTLEFTTTAIPEKSVNRTKAPNPFDGHFPADEQALSFEVPNAADSKEVAKLRTQAQQAARAVDRSARFTVSQSGTGKNIKSTVTTWTVPRITRARKTNA